MKHRHKSVIRFRMWILPFSGLVCAATLSVPALAQDAPPLLAERAVAAITGELSGTIAKQTVQDLSRFHRMRGSRGFAHAVEAVRSQAETYGLSQVEVIELPADGEIFYGTQRSRPAWDADFAELWELSESDAGWARRRRIASWEDQPVSLAQDSASGKVTADLIDVGDGTSEEDYEGKNVRGRLVLAGAQPVSVYPLAVDRHGAAGIVSYAQNQRSAWWGEDENLIRWGHLHTFPPPKTFAFMVSLKQAREWRRRLADGEIVRLEAEVRAGQHAGSYDIVTGVISGHDPQVSDEQIVLSCHLDHQRPGANDNASGCATILEIARTLTKLIREGRLEPPRRTIRFIWPPEIEGTIALLNARPGLAAATRAVVHMDMVGGHAALTKAVFHVTRSPKSLPTFVNDVAEAYGRFVNEQSYRFAASGEAAYPLVDAGGGKEAALGRMADFSRGSDHEVWTEGSFRVPAIYLNDWPDRYIHTHADEIANIDATKLLRAAFIGGASAYYLAQLEAEDVPALWRIIEGHALERAAAALARAQSLVGESRVEARNVLRFQRDYERGVLASIGAFAAIPPAIREDGGRFLDQLDRLMPGFEDGRRLEADQERLGQVIYRRSDTPKGTMSAFGYSYFEDKVDAAGLPRPLLLEFQGRWGGGSEYAYEALNFVDGKRSVLEVRDDVSAIYGPIPLEAVAAYLDTLARIGVIRVGN